MFEIQTGLFREGSFIDNLRKCFIKVGLRKKEEGTLFPHYLQYVADMKGKLGKKKQRDTADILGDDNNPRELPRDSDLSLGALLLNVMSRRQYSAA